jgi:hypothetical protein
MKKKINNRKKSHLEQNKKEKKKILNGKIKE